jgi:polyhydroxybutyrate depolymerase
MRRILATVLAVTSIAAVLAGCGIRDGRPDPGPRAGTESRAIEVDGVTREYRVYLPEDLAVDPALVVMMHGGVGSAQQAERSYGWNAEADAGGFIVAYPDGKNRSWNAGECCGGAERHEVADVAFITALVGQLRDEFGISSDRTFATGMSNGAMMSYRLACETDLFAAIAPVAGTIVTPCDQPTPTSVLHIHGLDDGSVRMDGELGDGIAEVDGMPVADAVDVFRVAGGCDAAVTTVEGLVTTSSSTCDDDRRVVLVTVADAGHQWPGADDGAADPPSTALDATAVIWEFFDAA